MKHSKWLLILILILLIINATFFILWYALKGQDRVKSALENYLSNALSGKVGIGKLSANERQITANGLIFSDNNATISIEIKQVQIRYNLLRLITSGFKFNKVIKQITMYEPNLSVRYDLKPSEKAKKSTKIPDLTPYFDNLSIKNGNLHIIFTAKPGISSNDTLRIEEKLTDVNISVVNKIHSDIKFDAVSDHKGKFKASAILDKGLLSELKCEIDAYQPYGISLTGFEQIDTRINSWMDYSQINKQTKPDFSFFCQLEKTKFLYQNFNILLPDIKIQANPQYAYFNLKESRINSHLIQGGGYLYQYLENPYLNANATISKLVLSEFTPLLKGNVSGKINAVGHLNDLTANGSFQLPEVQIENETVTNLKLEATYADNIVSFSTDFFNWRNQLSKASGDFELPTTKLNLNFATSPVYYDDLINLSAEFKSSLDFSDGLSAETEIINLEFFNTDISFRDFKGSVDLSLDQGKSKKNYMDLNLSNDKLIIKATGDPVKRELDANLQFNEFSLDNYLIYAEKQNIDTMITGIINAQLRQSDILGDTDLALQMNSPKSFEGEIKTAFSYDLSTNEGELDFRAENANAEKIPFDFTFKTKIDKKQLQVIDFNLDNVMSANGWLDFEDYYNSGFSLNVDGLNVAKYWSMFNPGNVSLPVFGNVSAALDYNLSQDKLVRGYVKTDSVLVTDFKPLYALIDFNGTTSDLEILAHVHTSENQGVNIRGSFSRKPKVAFKAFAELKNFDLSDYFVEKHFSGLINGIADWSLYLNERDKWEHNLGCNISGTKINVENIPVDILKIKAAQSNDVLLIDSLQVFSANMFDISGTGALDYNFLTNKYSGGSNSLNVSVEAEALKILKNFVPYFENARGRLISQFNIKTADDGIDIVRGTLAMDNGMLKMKDQPEAISDIDLMGTITHNEFKLDNLSCQVGQGRLFIRNEIDIGEDNFFIGPLNLGYFLVRTNDNGIQISIPDYLPVNTVATAVVKGQNSREATIKGPFDDMQFKAEIIASNGSAVYPAKTKNLLQLINVFQKKQEIEEIPLPFTLDLLIKIEDNVHYVTYPAFLTCQPGSFLHLVYDGNIWAAKEASFVSEKGTFDFYGTIFNVENVRLVINETNNIIAIDGTLTKKLADGTIITLIVLTNPQKGQEIFNQLEFKLTSDNPLDKTATQVLARLRYSRNVDELSPEQRQSLLQDEAMQLISTSVSTTYVSQFLSPIENRIRRFLKLDSFSITTGFVQNLFVEFATDNNGRANFNDPSNINADILQFSSSILLNNLSITMGKYIASKIFLDYEIHLQETTDLARKTKLDLYHNASIRLSLPYKFRFVYTFSIRPVRESNSHEVMLQRSFRF